MSATLSDVTIGVLGSGSDEHAELATELGSYLAGIGVNLLTGGGPGVMLAVSRAFTRARRQRGICIGIIPCASETERAKAKAGYPNEFVELAIYTHLPYSGARGKEDLSRNHINVLSCAALIVLPGAAGTASEVSLALDYGKPVIAYARDVRAVESFPKSVPRATTLEEVASFLSATIGGPAPRGRGGQVRRR